MTSLTISGSILTVKQPRYFIANTPAFWEGDCCPKTKQREVNVNDKRKYYVSSSFPKENIVGYTLDSENHAVYLHMKYTIPDRYSIIQFETQDMYDSAVSVLSTLFV